ncbi:unnamed protein product [Chironomus riparius]|uniref:Uncharacterized protein n=1 Tax=Chironomus riparius TaxID=315576 RepID=A0A9N9WMQ3_9DIPT|nr:unnamed protein product [Chironomus riparius]
MNQMDENYWKQLAQDWIRKQSQTSEVLLPKDLQIPEAPKISFTDNTNYDNLAVADMDIEDVKEEPVWNNSVHQIPTTIDFSNIQQTPFIQVPTVVQQISVTSSSSRFHKNHDAPRKSHYTQHQPLIIPDPPSMNNIEDQINTIDMDMDDSDNDDSNSNSASSVGMMDIQKRKKLPIWIREGLEKIKREKELEKARLREELKQKEDEENRKKLMEEALKEIEKEKVSKSKYESSDSETEETDNNVPQNQHEPIENDEEAFEKMMLLVRKTLTQLLLEVTDEKIQEISTETLSKYRKKASATSKPPALIGLGLGAYSSSTDEEDSEHENGENSDWETDSVLRERIHKKQAIFEKLVNERIDKQTAEEEERLKKRSSSKSEAKHAKIRHSDSDDDRQKKFKSTRKDGEEKYETMIYSISTSSGPLMRVPREKKTRFSDPKDGRSTTQMTHLGMVDSTRSTSENGTNMIPKIIVPQLPRIVEKAENSESPKKEKKKKRRDSSSSSSDSGHRKKHKKHKKSSKNSKKSSKKKDKSRSPSRSRDKDKRHHSRKSDRRSIESKSSIRSESSRRRSRSHSRSQERHRRRY